MRFRVLSLLLLIWMAFLPKETAAFNCSSSNTKMDDGDDILHYNEVQCSGHGVCDVPSGQCLCAMDYAGEQCEVVSGSVKFFMVMVTIAFTSSFVICLVLMLRALARERNTNDEVTVATNDDNDDDDEGAAAYKVGKRQATEQSTPTQLW
jgi:cbb3-type cytochrome oxidase subunit 3